MSVLKKFMGQTAIYGVSTVLSRLFGFILTPIYTSAYGSATYGILTKLFAYASLINAVLAFGMESTYFRYLNKHEDKKQEVYNNSFFCIAGIATLFLLTGLVFRNSIAGYLTADLAQLDDYKNYVSYFIWILFVDAICVIPFARLRAEDKAVKYSIIKFSNIGVFVVFNLLFIKVIPAMMANDWPMSGWMSGWYKTGWVGYVFVSNLIASLLTFIMLLPEFLKLQLRFDKELFAKMFSYSWPVLIANLSFIVNENLDKIALSELLPAAIADRDVGIYGAVCKIAVFMSIFITAFRLGAEPFFFSHAKNENAKHTYALIMRYFVIALTLIFVGLVANIEILKHFISRNGAHIAEYWVGLPAVPYLLFGYVCLGIYSNLAIWYRLSDQTRYGLYISLVGAAVTIGLNFVLIPRFSYMGSAWVSMLAYFVMMVISYVLGQRHYPIPYELKRIAAYLLVSVVLVALSFWVFNRNIYIGNALLIVFTAGVFYFEKDGLRKVLKR
ncbi:MAG: polysaccharide biosynthesis protein [Pedobacter sp.]|nr:MAG: polysaccharide biosynthesis protein [Pedobacter sp.]